MAKDTEIEDIAANLDQARKDWDKANNKFQEAVSERNTAHSKMDKYKKLLQDKLNEKYGI